MSFFTILILGCVYYLSVAIIGAKLSRKYQFSYIYFLVFSFLGYGYFPYLMETHTDYSGLTASIVMGILESTLGFAMVKEYDAYISPKITLSQYDFQFKMVFLGVFVAVVIGNCSIWLFVS